MAKEYICKICNHIGEVDGEGLRGSFVISNILWILVIPGLIYSIWRRAGKKTCRNCHSNNVIRLNSVEGKEMMEKILLENIINKK
jgi:hypothetical protein